MKRSCHPRARPGLEGTGETGETGEKEETWWAIPRIVRMYSFIRTIGGTVCLKWVVRVGLYYLPTAKAAGLILANF